LNERLSRAFRGNFTSSTDKNFENSVFTKLFLEKSGTAYLKPIYKNQTVAVWE
jgi:hypothetical protein